MEATNDRGVAVMQSNRNENRIFLRGKLEGAPAASHENHGISYYILPMAVQRLSGAEDHLNVVVSSQQLAEFKPEVGERFCVSGEVRTYNNRSGTGNRLVVSVFAKELGREPGEDENRLELSGTLCKPAGLRSTPLGRTICDMILAVNRRYGRADYLPCIAWGSLAYRCAGLSVGDPVRLAGRLQSRTYTKAIGDSMQERVAFEVSVMSMEPEGSPEDT